MSSELTKHLIAGQQTSPDRERSTDLTKLNIGEAGALVRRKVVSPVELTRACLERIERLNLATIFLVERQPSELWGAKVPGAQHWLRGT